MTNRRIVQLFALALLLAAGIPALAQQALSLTGDIGGTHDPSMIREGNTWYVFATGHAPRQAGGGQISIRCSTDLHDWHLCGHVFDHIPDWIHQRSPNTRDLWAPDIAFSHGLYRLYYVYSILGKNTSGIALATNVTLDPQSPRYHWVDQGLVLASRSEDNFNAIDPNFIEDKKGHDWMAFGSFWTGIKLRRLDDETGKLSPKDSHVYSLAERAIPEHWEHAASDPHAIEAPFIVHHGRYFYLFTSWDLCCIGAKSTYRIMVGRSKSITGPYKDEAGKRLLDGGGTELLHSDAHWSGPGGESVVMGKDGTDLIAFHAYDATSGTSTLHLSTIDWRDDWPHIALEP